MIIPDLFKVSRVIFEPEEGLCLLEWHGKEGLYLEAEITATGIEWMAIEPISKIKSHWTQEL